MLGHYLVIATFADFSSNAIEENYESEHEEDSDNEEVENIFEMAKYYNESYSSTNTIHPFIRNYPKIINASNYIKPEIMQVIILDSGETVAILKTIWIRIFQRTCRRKFAKRIAFYKNINNINKSRMRGPLYYRW